MQHKDLPQVLRSKNCEFFCQCEASAGIELQAYKQSFSENGLYQRPTSDSYQDTKKAFHYCKE